MRIESRFSVKPIMTRAGAQGPFRSSVLRLLHVLILLVACAGLLAPAAWAQGSRKDDIVFNAQGRPMAGASVRICTSTATGQPCTPLANVYSDPALTQALANPLTTDGLGNYTFYAAPGRYEIEISGPNITTEQFPNVILPNDPSTPTFTSLSTTSGISAFSLSLGGNLTVSGSAAVTGTLTVGGAPIPSTAEANTWTATQTFQGPSPWVDVAAYGARAITTTGYTTTCSVSSSSTALACASAAQFHNGDGISVYGGGATNSLSTPSAPTVTPSLAAHATGTGVDVNAPSGSTPFSYKVVALGSWSATAGSNLWGAYTAASAAGATTTGNTLGSQTQTIGTLSEQNGVLTVTCSAACPMAVGAYVSIIGTSNDPFFAGQYIVASVTSTTQFTLNVGSNTSATVTGTGGTLNWFASNHVTWTAVSGAFEYAIYGRTSGSWTLVGISWPGVTWWDDFGSTMMGNLTSYGWLPTSAPSTAQNGVLTTTVTAGGGTTSLTLATAATNSVTSRFATFDDAPIFAAAATSAHNAGGPLYVPCNSSVSGSRFIIGSYLQMAAGSSINVQQCGSLWLDDPFEWDGGLNWFGHVTGNNNGAAPVALTAGAEIDVDTAYPGIYSPNPTSIFADHTFLNQYPGTNNALLSYLQNGGGPGVIWTNSTWQTTGNADYMGIHLIIGPNNETPDDTFTNDSWIAGPAQSPNLTTTPLVIFQNAGQVHIDNCSINRRGLAEVGAGLAIQVTTRCWVQGPITPFLMSNASSEAIGGTVLENILEDTSGQPLFANWSTGMYNGTIEIHGGNLDAPGQLVTGTGVANLVVKDGGFPATGGSTLGQNTKYSQDAAAYIQALGQTQGQLGGVTEQSKPNYQAQPNPQNYFIEQLPGAPSSSASSGGSLTGTHSYSVVAHFANGTSRAGPQGNGVTLSGGNGTIVSTFSTVPGAISYDVWGDSTRGLPLACTGLTTLTCTDNGGALEASSGEPNAPSDGFPSFSPNGINTPELNNVVFPSTCSSAGITAAEAKLPAAGGTVDAKGCQGTVSITSTVTVGTGSKQVNLILGNAMYTGTVNPLFVIDRASQLTCNAGSTISQTANGSNAIVLAGTGASWVVGAITGPCTIAGPGAPFTSSASITSTAAGVVWGGSADAGNSTSNGAQSTRISDVLITGFKYCVKFGTNTYNTLALHMRCQDDTQAIYEADALTNTGETLDFTDSIFANTYISGNYVNCIQFATASSGYLSSVHVTGGSMDECAPTTATGVTYSETQVHHENPDGTAAGLANPTINCGGGCNLTNIEIYEDGSVTKSESILMSSGSLSINGGTFDSRNVTTPEVVLNNSTGSLAVAGLAQLSGYTTLSVQGSTGSNQVYANGVLSLNNQPWMYANPPAALTDGATITLNAASQANPWYTVTLGGNRTLNVSGMVAGGTYKLFVRQPASGGPDTLALGTGCTWINNPLAWSTTANTTDLLVWWYDGTNCWVVQGTINGPVSYGTPAASAATNFGSAIGSTNLIASAPATGVYNVGGSAYVSTAGAGCSSATNSATVTWAWTDATGTSQTATGPLVSVTGNGTLGATTVSSPLSIVAETGTAISYSVASTLGSTGCSTTPKYTVQLKSFN